MKNVHEIKNKYISGFQQKVDSYDLQKLYTLLLETRIFFYIAPMRTLGRPNADEGKLYGSVSCGDTNQVYLFDNLHGVIYMQSYKICLTCLSSKLY